VCTIDPIAARAPVIPRKEVHVVSAQLMKGCTPRVPAGYKHIVTAQLEVAAGKVSKIIEPPKAEAV
jgi:hypothetical protein